MAKSKKKMGKKVRKTKSLHKLRKNKNAKKTKVKRITFKADGATPQRQMQAQELFKYLPNSMQKTVLDIAKDYKIGRGEMFVKDPKTKEFCNVGYIEVINKNERKNVIEKLRIKGLDPMEDLSDSTKVRIFMPTTPPKTEGALLSLLQRGTKEKEVETSLSKTRETTAGSTYLLKQDVYRYLNSQLASEGYSIEEKLPGRVVADALRNSVSGINIEKLAKEIEKKDYVYIKTV